jgi:hypothetical protein
MKRESLIFVASLAALSAHADTVIDDFTVAAKDVVMVDNSNAFGSDPSFLGHAFLGNRNIQGANYVGNGTDTFTIHAGGDGMLSATGVGTAGGLLQLAYGESPSGVADLSGFQQLTLDIKSTDGPITIGWGAFSGGGGFDHETTAGLAFGAGFSGPVTLDFKTLGSLFTGSKVGSLFIDVHVDPGHSVVFDNLTANVTPEPMSFAPLALGVLAFARKRKR